MMLSLYWKNIWRNKTRSFIIIFAIVFGVIGGVGFVAFFNGLIFQRIDIAIGNEVSNIQLHNPNYQENKEIKDIIADLTKVQQVLDTCKRIKGYSARVKSTAMVNSANSGAGVMLNGIDPDREKKVTNIYHYVNQGEYLSLTKKNGILIGQKLAQKLKIKLRSKVVITMQTISGDITSAAFKVVGIYQTSNSTFDERNAYVIKDNLLAVIGFNTPVAHEISIALYSDKENEQVLGSLKNKLNAGDLSIQSWKEIMPELSLFTDIAEYMLYIFMFIIFLALSFGIINTMLMAVLDRAMEIGMLMAIGMNKGRIFRMILSETILLMLTGSLIGLFLSYLLVMFFAKHGIDLSAFSSGLSGFGFSTKVYPFLESGSYIKIVMMVVITGFFSALIPAKRALKYNPSEAIRN